MRDPAQIVDDVARDRNMVSPVAEEMALSRRFTEACIAEAVSEARAEWAEQLKPRERQEQSTGAEPQG